MWREGPPHVRTWTTVLPHKGGTEKGGQHPTVTWIVSTYHYCDKGNTWVWGLGWGGARHKVGVEVTETKLTCLPFYRPVRFEKEAFWDIFFFQFLFLRHFGKFPVNPWGKSFCVQMGPAPAVPFVGRNFSFFSFQLHLLLILKLERYQQSSKSSGFELNRSQIPAAGSDPKSWARAFPAGTAAENVFSRNVSLGLESLKMSVESAFPGLATPNASRLGNFRGLGVPELPLASQVLC